MSIHNLSADLVLFVCEDFLQHVEVVELGRTCRNMLQAILPYDICTPISATKWLLQAEAKMKEEHQEENADIPRHGKRVRLIHATDVTQSPPVSSSMMFRIGKPTDIDVQVLSQLVHFPQAETIRVDLDTQDMTQKESDELDVFGSVGFCWTEAHTLAVQNLQDLTVTTNSNSDDCYLDITVPLPPSLHTLRWRVLPSAELNAAELPPPFHMLPSSLLHLTISGVPVKYLCGGSENDVRWPSCLQTLKLSFPSTSDEQAQVASASASAVTDFICLPASLTHLHIDGHVSLPQFRFPSSLHSLILGPRFDAPLGNGPHVWLPPVLHTLQVSNHSYAHSFEAVAFPDTLRFIDVCHLPRDGLRHVRFPESLEYFQLRGPHHFETNWADIPWPRLQLKGIQMPVSREYDEDDNGRGESGPWTSMTLPPTLTYLGLMGEFNQPLPVLPPSLLHLRLPGYFRQCIQASQIPASLQTLSFETWPRSCRNFDLELPPTVRVLMFHFCETRTFPLAFVRRHFALTNPGMKLHCMDACPEEPDNEHECEVACFRELALDGPLDPFHSLASSLLHTE